MPSSQQANARADKLWILCLTVVLPLAIMMLRGIDASWDLRNYHLYNPHAWLTGRMDMDVAPAQLQTFHNPLLDVPLYLIITSGAGARWASAWLTLPSLAVVYLLLRLQTALSPLPFSRTSRATLALIGLSGAATFSTLATSTNDGFVAAGILFSLLLVVSQTPVGGENRRWLLAGLVAGAIAGLKLSASFYCIGLAFASMVEGGWREKLHRCSQLALGGATGFAATYGYWGWKLFQTHANPFFPYYNDLFQSPDALPNAFTDARFRPPSALDALLTPIHLLSKSHLFSEPALKDPRILIGLVGLLALYFIYRGRGKFTFASKVSMLLVFFVTSFSIWIVQYGIYRYAIALELIGSLVLVLLVQALPRKRNIALFVALLVVSADTRRPNWSHVASDAPLAGIRAPGIPADSLVVLASGEPLAYLVLGLPPGVPLVSVTNNFMAADACTGLHEKARRTIVRHQGPIWLLSTTQVSADEVQPMLSRRYGLERGGACIPYPSAFETATLCPQRRVGTAVNACPAR